MKRIDKVTYMTCEAILQVIDYEQAKKLLLTIPDSFFDKGSVDAFLNYTKALQHMFNIADADQKYFCNVRLKRIMISLYRHALMNILTADDPAYDADNIKKLTDIFSIAASLYSDRGQIEAAKEMQRTIKAINEKFDIINQKETVMEGIKP